MRDRRKSKHPRNQVFDTRLWNVQTFHALLGRQCSVYVKFAYAETVDVSGMKDPHKYTGEPEKHLIAQVCHRSSWKDSLECSCGEIVLLDRINNISSFVKLILDVGSAFSEVRNQAKHMTPLNNQLQLSSPAKMVFSLANMVFSVRQPYTLVRV